MLKWLTRETMVHAENKHYSSKPKGKRLGLRRLGLRTQLPAHWTLTGTGHKGGEPPHMYTYNHTGRVEGV